MTTIAQLRELRAHLAQLPQDRLIREHRALDGLDSTALRKIAQVDGDDRLSVADAIGFIDQLSSWSSRMVWRRSLGSSPLDHAFQVGQAAITPPAPQRRVLPLPVDRQISIPTRWSEGLDFMDGSLWQATETELHRLDAGTGETLASYPSPAEYGESITEFHGAIWHVDHLSNQLLRGTLTPDVFEWQTPGVVPEAGAWGIAHNDTQLIVTGRFSSELYFLNPESCALERQIHVNVRDLEDLAWDGESLWASSFHPAHTGVIYRVDPDDGRILGRYQVPGAERDIIDGLAVRDGELYITGKDFGAIYVVPLEDL